MNLARLSKNAGIAIVRVVCAVVFAVFTFVYLYCYQADVLAAAQFMLSDGATHYDRAIGATLITLGLLLLQWAVMMVARLRGFTHSLTYFPSALLLAVVTSVTADDGGSLCWASWWWWLLPVLLLVWLACTYVAMKWLAKPYIATFFLKSLWMNVAALAAMFVFVGAVGNSDDVLHYRMRVETRLMENDFDGALETGQKSLKTDRSLTMLRAYALARKGELGERLFTYPLTESSADLLPMPGDRQGAHCVMLPTDSIYKSLGARPLSTQKSARAYLDALVKSGKATGMVADYVLCGMLVDRDIDGFARLLPRYYKINDKLPRHYREALTLYTHTRSNPALVYNDEVMDTDFDDFIKLQRQYKDDNARRLAVFDQYSGTYWAYYDY